MALVGCKSKRGGVSLPSLISASLGGFSFHVHILGDGGQLRIGGFLLLQCLFQKMDDLLLPQKVSKGLCGAVRRDFIVLYPLCVRNQSGIEDILFAAFLDPFVRLLDQPLLPSTGLAFGVSFRCSKIFSSR